MLDEFERGRAALLAELAECAELGRDVGAQSLATRLESEVASKLLSGCFHLVVVGEFNHGKTSFVNALLGASVLPVGVTPTTAWIHHVVHSEQPSARAVFEGGRELPLEVAQLRRFVAQDADPAAPNEPTLAEVPGADVACAEGDAAPSYIELGYPSELLRNGIVLVDTPGVNDLSLSRAEITYGYIPRSDAVLFLIDAGQPLKASERRFLEQQLLERSRDKIVFVITKADIWTESERSQALEYVHGRLAKLVPSPRLFAVSAERELADRSGGFDALVDHLKQFLAEERGKILLDNSAGDAQRILTSMRHGIEARRRSAGLSLEQIARRIAALESELEGNHQSIEQRRLEIREAAGAIKTGARRDLERFVEDTLSKLPGLLEEASGEDVRLHLGAFIEQAFREFLEQEATTIAADLEKLSERMVALLSDDADLHAEELARALGQSMKSPSIEVDTFAYDFGILAVMTVGLGALFANALLGGALLVAAPALALWHRGRTEKEIKRRAGELLPQALQRAAAEVAPELDNLVDGFTKALDAWVVSALRELHVELVEVLRAARAQREQGEGERGALEAQADAFAARLDAKEAALQAYRLQPPSPD